VEVKVQRRDSSRRQSCFFGGAREIPDTLADLGYLGKQQGGHSRGVRHDTAAAHPLASIHWTPKVCILLVLVVTSLTKRRLGSVL
jgi:hypothetical protein